MKNIRGLADKVMETHLNNLDSKVDCYVYSQLISLLNRQAKSAGKINIEVNKTVGIISYPYQSKKLEECQELSKIYGFDVELIRLPSEIPFYFEDLNLIIPRDGAMHRLTTLWNLSKTGTYELKVEKMDLPDYFLEFMVIDKKNKTADGFRLCDIEVDFILALQKKARRERLKIFFLEWVKSKFARYV